MSDQTGSNKPQSKDELLRRIDQSLKSLEATLRPLREEQLLRPGPDGWSIKDHIAHIAAWELSVANLMLGGKRFTDPKIVAAIEQNASEDDVNDLIHQSTVHLTLQQVMEAFSDAHSQMMQALDGMEVEDLHMPYESFLPSEEQTGEDTEPILTWVINNTYHHYDEHNEWIQERLKTEAAGKE